MVKTIKNILNLYFEYDLNNENLNKINFFTFLFPYYFDEFPTLNDFKKHRINNYGGFINFDFTKTNNKIYLIFSYSFIDDEFLKSNYLDFILNLFFKDNHFKIDEGIFNNKKNEYIKYIHDLDYDASYLSFKNLAKNVFNNDTFNNLFYDSSSIIESLTIKDIQDVFYSLRNNCVKYKCLNDNVEIQDKINKYLTINHRQINYTFNNEFYNTKTIILKDNKITNNSYSLIFKLPYEENIIKAIILEYYLNQINSFIFSIIREKYGYIYAFEASTYKSTSIAHFEMTLKKENIEKVKQIFNDFFLNSTKYLSKKQFMELKKSYLEILKSKSSSKLNEFVFFQSYIFDNEFSDIKSMIDYIKDLKYIDFINYIQKVEFLGDCFIEVTK